MKIVTENGFIVLSGIVNPLLYNVEQNILKKISIKVDNIMRASFVEFLGRYIRVNITYKTTGHRQIENVR